MVRGQVVTGKFGEILMRVKQGKEAELGELFIAENSSGKVLLQAFDLQYGSQISQENLELVSGMMLEQGGTLDFMEPELRNYSLAMLKTLVFIQENQARSCKVLPTFFSLVRDVTAEDLSFLTQPKNPLFIGQLRSGSKELDFPIYLDGREVFSHHVLIPATTGKGKSNLMSVVLWDTLDKDYCALLVLDPHDEYYERLKNHPKKERLAYYSRSPPAGGRTLRFNLKILRPHHFDGSAEWSGPQKEALTAYYRLYGEGWIEAAMIGKTLADSNGKNPFNEGSIAVVRRRFSQILDLEFNNNQLFCNGAFQLQGGETTVADTLNELEKAHTVVIDTSGLSSSTEILIGSILATEILGKYKYYKNQGSLKDKPVVSIVLEEAPRVLGKEVLESGPNVFATIAREGRKFQVGLTAITQLPSLIPREILANINTKIILGIEMAPERQAVIDSASQDLSTDGRSIAALDKGEAIITSNFARFATPIKVPLFDVFVKKTSQEMNIKKSYTGLKN